MNDFNTQLLDGLLVFLTSKPIAFTFEHSLLIGFISGVMSLMPFAIKRIIHVLILLVAFLAAVYLTDQAGLKIQELFYYKEAFFIVELIGNYIFGCLGGFVIANLIQRIRGEHDYVANN